jgi:hypothetical protein
MKRTHRSFFLVGTALVGFLLAFGSQPSEGSLIFTFLHTYDGGNIDIALNVFDGQPGGRYLWEYTVTNSGYDPNPGTSNGFSGFELFLPSPIPEIADITAPGGIPPWEINCCSGNPVEWDIRNSDGNGVMPGFSGIFSFTTDPRAVAINNDGWFHTWQNNGQTNIITTLGMHVPWVPGLVPEPGTLALVCLGLFLALKRRPR